MNPEHWVLSLNKRQGHGPIRLGLYRQVVETRLRELQGRMDKSDTIEDYLTHFSKSKQNIGRIWMISKIDLINYI